MSKESRKELINAVNWMKLFSPVNTTYCMDQKKKVKFRLNFITLTLSGIQEHPDKYIKQHMLEPFLKWMSRKGANTYVWKAETQNNGNIHFHITSNQYIYWKSIRDKWNDLQKNHGYLKQYFDKFGHHDANSTDVHAVRDDSQIGVYISKELGKSDSWSTFDKTRTPAKYLSHPSRYIEMSIKVDKPMPLPKRQIEGRKWSISNNLTGIRCFINQESEGSYKLTTDFLNSQDHKSFDLDFAKIWFYPHLIDGKAPPEVAERLKYLQKNVRDYNE